MRISIFHLKLHLFVYFLKKKSPKLLGVSRTQCFRKGSGAAGVIFILRTFTLFLMESCECLSEEQALIRHGFPGKHISSISNAANHIPYKKTKFCSNCMERNRAAHTFLRYCLLSNNYTCAQGIILFLSNIHKIFIKIRNWNTFAYTYTPAIKKII